MYPMTLTTTKDILVTLNSSFTAASLMISRLPQQQQQQQQQGMSDMESINDNQLLHLGSISLTSSADYINENISHQYLSSIHTTHTSTGIA
jgi:hypothetical protein